MEKSRTGKDAVPAGPEDEALARRRAEEALAESEGRYRLLASNSVDMISRHADDGTVLYVSPACRTLSGYTEAELMGGPAEFLSLPEDRELVWDVIRRSQEIGDQYRVEHRLRRKDGSIRWVETLGRFVRDEAGRVTEIQCNVRDVTERKRAEAALRESEERLRFISDHLPGGLVYQIDSGPDGRWRRFTYVSRGVERLHEISAAEAMEDASRVYQQVYEEDRAMVAELEAAALESMAPFRAEIRMVLPSGRTAWRLFASAPRRLPDGRVVWDGIEIDVTRRKLQEETERRVRTLEGLGTIAGGIAHDFNNLLTGVFVNIELAAIDLAPDDPARATLQLAHQSLESARQLAGRLLTFAKGGHPVLQAVDLRQHICDTVRFHLSGSSVAAGFDIPPDLWPVKADKGQISEVLSNLTVNAREAMPAGGTLHVRARNVPDAREAGAPQPRRDCVELTFRDEGVGIPSRIAGRIFDPYFTTKQAGSGLGLAIVHGIISRHEGQISVESVPDVGTTFTVLLPAETPHGGQPAGAAPPDLEARPAAFGRVLLMDDEEMIRRTTSRSLERLGYTVQTASGGREAVETYAEAMRLGRPFDAAILDLTIPGGMGGIEVMRELLALDPSAKGIVSSGYSSDPVLADYAAHGFSGCLAKPFRLQELGRTLRRVLEPR